MKGSVFVCVSNIYTFVPRQNDKQKLKDLLNYHITTSSLTAADIANNHIATTRADMPLRVNLYNRVSNIRRIFLTTHYSSLL